jgi:hypothetical protein
VGVLSCAAWLAQTTPALHEPDPYWWLPFRWSLEATWAEPGLRTWIVGGLLVAAVGAAAVLQGRRLGWTRLGAAGLLAGAGTLGWALAVPAYPTTYKRSQVPYLTVSVASGRALYGESDRLVADKFSAALTSGLIPILCIGETLQEREQGQTEAVLARQIKAVLDGMLAREGRTELARACFAFLPVRAALDLAGWPEEDIFAH